MSFFALGGIVLMFYDGVAVVLGLLTWLRPELNSKAPLPKMSPQSCKALN